MAVNAQMRFEKAMSVSINNYSPKATRALDLAGKVAVFIAGCTFFGLIFTSNFVKLPKWAIYGVGLTVPLVIGVAGSVLKGKAKERQERQHAREDALQMTLGPTIDLVGESRLSNDFRFRTCKLQIDSGQQPPPSTQELRKVADNYHLDVPVPTAAQILHGLNDPIDWQAHSRKNKKSNLNREKYQTYLANRMQELRKGRGPLFKVAKTKPGEPEFWEMYLPLEIQEMLKQWRVLCDYWNLHSVLPFKRAVELFEKLPKGLTKPASLTDSCAGHASFYSQWSQEFYAALVDMEKEYNKRLEDYIKRRYERLELAYRELANIASDEHSSEKRIAKMRSELKSLEIDFKVESWRHLLTQILSLQEESVRLIRLRSLLRDLNPEANDLDDEALIAALKNLDFEKIDGESLDRWMNLDMQVYAAHVKHPAFKECHSLYKPLCVLSRMLDSIEEALNRGDSDVVHRLNQFELREMNITKRYLKRELPLEVDVNAEACALDQTIDQVLQAQHQLVQNSQNSWSKTHLEKAPSNLRAMEARAKKQHLEPKRLDDCIEGGYDSLVIAYREFADINSDDPTPQARIAKMRRELNSFRMDFKASCLKRLYYKILSLEEESVRLILLRDLLQDINGQPYDLMEGQGADDESLARAFDRLDIEKIDQKRLDRWIRFNMRSYAAHVKHRHFAHAHSLSRPIDLLSSMLDQIEADYIRGDLDALDRLDRFALREMDVTRRYLVEIRSKARLEKVRRNSKAMGAPTKKQDLPLERGYDRLVIAYREFVHITSDEPTPEERIAKMRRELNSFRMNEKIDQKRLGRWIRFNMRTYAAHVKHRHFAHAHSLSRPIDLLSSMLDQIEADYIRGDLDALDRLDRFALREMDVTRRYLEAKPPLEVNADAEAWALEQKIDELVQEKHRLLLSQSVWRPDVEKARRNLKAMEARAKKQHLERFVSLVSKLPEESVRRIRYGNLLEALDPELYQNLKHRKNARPFRMALESLDSEKIDFAILDRLMSQPIPGMKTYAQAVGHHQFAESPSMHRPFLSMQLMLDDIERAFKNNEPDASKLLNQFLRREFAATNYYLNSGGQSHLRNAFAHKKLEPYVEAEPLVGDPPAVAGQKRIKEVHYGALLAYDKKIHKIQTLGLGVGFQLLSTAIMVAAIFVKHRYASMALNGSVFLLVGGNMCGESRVGDWLKKKRTMLMREYLHKKGVGSVQGKEARRVKRDCDRLGIDGESAIADAIIGRKERDRLSWTDRLRGKFITPTASREASQLAPRITAWASKNGKKGENPVLETIRAALRQNQSEPAKALAPYAENPGRARNLIKLYSRRRVNMQHLPEFMHQVHRNGDIMCKSAKKNASVHWQKIIAE